MRAMLTAIVARTRTIAGAIRRRRSRGDLESVIPELVAIGCFLLLLWASIGIAINHEYGTAKSAAMQSTANLARAFEESTRRTVGQIDQILLSARAFYSVQGNRFNFIEWARTQTLPDQMTAGIAMADSSGNVLADTLPSHRKISIADRPHFLAQLNSSRDELNISPPMLGRVTNQYKPRGRAARGAAAPPLRELGDDTASGKPIVLREGRFGPYVTDGETNASLRKGDAPEAITLQRAIELLAERRAAAPSTKRRTTSRQIKHGAGRARPRSPASHQGQDDREQARRHPGQRFVGSQNTQFRGIIGAAFALPDTDSHTLSIALQ